MEARNPLLDEFVLRLTGRARPNVCFLPQASGDADHYIVRFYRAFGADLCVPSHLSLFRRLRSPRAPRRHLLAQDLMLSRNSTTQPWIGQNLIGEGGYPADTLAFVTGNQQSQQRDRPEADAARVVYAKVDKKLVRFVRPNIYTLSEEGIRQTDVADAVAGFNIRYYDSQARVWIEQWDGRSRKTLPQGFMIELILQREDEPPKTFTSWLTLPS